MTNAAITSTPREWHLTGIAAGAGQCDCCARRITQRVFEVAHPDLGVASLGRRCAAKATGYAASAIERELARVARLAEVAARRAVIAAARPVFGPVHSDMLAWQALTDDERTAAPRRNPGPEYLHLSEVFGTAATTDAWWGGRGWTACATWAEYVDALTAA